VTNYINTSEKANFSTLRSTQIAMMRTGTGNAPWGYNTRKMYDYRWSIFDYYGKTSFSKMFGKYSSADRFDQSQEGPNVVNSAARERDRKRIDKMTSSLARQTSRLLQDAPYALTNWQPGHIENWLSGTLSRLTFTALHHAKEAVTTDFERSKGMKDGEINGMFGMVGRLLNNIMTSAGAGRWDGNLYKDGGVDGGAMGMMFADWVRGGSMDRLVQQMNYTLNGVLTGDFFNQGQSAWGKYRYSGRKTATGRFAPTGFLDPEENDDRFGRVRGYTNVSNPGDHEMWGADNYDVRPDAAITMSTAHANTAGTNANSLQIEEDWGE
jgi:hypothetical protein